MKTFTKSPRKIGSSKINLEAHLCHHESGVLLGAHLQACPSPVDILLR